MPIIKAAVIAFSIYSKIPVPIFEWKEEDMKYHLIFFPWVGAVIAFLTIGWDALAVSLGLGDLCRTLILVAIPLLITGGFHVDGFMDTCDAFRSYQPKEEKLQILKDPHIGAFAVITLATIGLIFTAAVSEIRPQVMPLFACGYFLSRSLSAIAVICFPNARKTGMLHTFSATAQGDSRKMVLSVIILQAILCSALMIYMNHVTGVITIMVALASFFYYYKRTQKELGGITGDTAGYFVTVAETAMAVTSAVCSMI